MKLPLCPQVIAAVNWQTSQAVLSASSALRSGAVSGRLLALWRCRRSSEVFSSGLRFSPLSNSRDHISGRITFQGAHPLIRAGTTPGGNNCSFEPFAVQLEQWPTRSLDIVSWNCIRSILSLKTRTAFRPAPFARYKAESASAKNCAGP